jgi:hypothetical protein
MGGYVKSGAYWHIASNKDFSQENFKKWETRIDELDRVQIENLHEISQSNLNELYERILKKRKSLPLRIFNFVEKDLSLISNFTELESLSVELPGRILNIEVLENFKNLKALHLDCDSQENLDFLWNINSSLERLSIMVHGSKRSNLDLTPVSNFKTLKHLYLKGYNKNIENAVSEFTEIETLALRSISRPKNLDFISRLTSLKDLIIQSCSFENINAISKLPNIRYLQLWRLAKLNDINVVSVLNNLQYIFIETLNGLETFPEISNLPKLRRVKISSCKNIRDFSSIEKSVSLTGFIIQNASNNDINDFIPIFKNPNINELGIGYQKVSTQVEIAKLAAKYNKIPKTYMYPEFENEFEYE